MCIMLKLVANLILITCLVILVEGKSINHREERAIQKYTSKYDNIDIDAIVASRRLLQNYINCLLDLGPCNAEGKELKKYLPDALATECEKCTEQQKKIGGKVLGRLLLDHKEEFDKLTNKYDPEGKFYKKYIPESDAKDYSDYDEA